MTNTILAGIAVSLGAEFGEKIKVHIERERQHLKEPCFFISCIHPTHERVIGRRFFRRFSIAVQYFPADRQKEVEECNDVAERLYHCLEWISVSGDPLMGSRMRHEIVDGILTFFVDYSLFVHREKENIPMENMTLNPSVKEVNENGS